MAGIWGRAKGALEAGATLASGAIAEPVAGWAGILSGGNADQVAKTRQALTYAPKTPEGQQAVQGIGDILGKLKDAAMKSPIGSAVNGFNAVADRAGEVSPALGAAVKTAPAALGMLFGPGGTATRQAVGNVARGTAQGVERAAITAAENAAAVPAMRGPMAHEKGIFAGHLSKEAPIWKLEQAKTMQALGKSDKEIYQHTGWFAGSADGQWRYEIPDNEAQFNLSKAPVDEYGAQELPIYEALNHPQLQQAYPQLGDIKVQHWPDEEYQGANFNSATNEIQMGHEAMERGASVPLHEMQHAIQDLEGFARGGSQDALIAERKNALSDMEYAQNKMQPLENRIGAEASDMLRNGISPEQRAQLLSEAAQSANMSVDDLVAMYGGNEQEMLYDALYESLKKTEPALGSYAAQIEQNRSKLRELGKDPYDAYRRLAGEAEARLVQARMAMSPEERAASYPPDMYDVPVDQQIVRYGANGPQEAIGGRGPIATALADKYPELDGYLMEPEGKPAVLSKIVVPPELRNQGMGTAFMNDLTQLADENGTRVALTPASDFGGNKARLEQFYKRFGFVPNKGRTKDYEISEGMYRDPMAGE